MLVGLMCRIVGGCLSNLYKRQVYAGIMEILRDNKYYYRSIVGDNYSHFTDDGAQELIKFMNLMAPEMLRIEKQELDDRARELVTTALKE